MPTCATCGHQSENDFNFCPSCGASAGGEEAGGLVGRILNGKYKIVRQIGQGAMGVVYEGEHVALQKRVALKVLHPDLGVTEDSLRRFQQEGIAAGRFNHLGAIQIFDFDREGDRILYLAMEFIDGEDLKTYLGRKGRLSPAETVSIGVQVLSVLSEAHALGIIHRDLKPDNIMVLKHSGEGVLIKVLDFGLSKLVDVPLGASMQTQVGRIMGTPLYMAPEQVAADDVDHRVDLYAMGLILYELLAGVTPFPDQSTTEVLFSRATREAPSINDSFPDLGIPPRLDVILKKAMQRRREDRYETAAEMLAEIEALLGSPDGLRATGSSGSRAVGKVAPKLAQPEPTPRKARALRWQVLRVALPLLVLGGLAYWLGGPGRSSTDSPTRLAQGDTTAGSEQPNTPAAPAPSEEMGLYATHLEVTRRSFAAGDLDGALVHVSDALALGLEDPEALDLRAEILFEKGELAAARADVEAGRSRFGATPRRETLAGWVELEDGDLEAAAAAFKTASELAAQGDEEPYAPALAGLAALDLARGDLPAAHRGAQAATEADVNLALAHRVLGQVALAEGDPAAALTSLFRARSLAPQDWRVYLALGNAYRQSGDLFKAEKQLVEARNRNADALAVRQLLAATFVERELWPEARDEVRDALSRAPGDGRLLILQGIVLAAQDQTQRAIETLERGLATGLEDGAAQALVATLYHGLGEVVAARDHYENARKLDDSLAEPWLNLGLIELDEGHWQSAIDLFQGALRRDSELTTALFALGVAQRDYAGERDAALKTFQRYRRQGGRDRRVEGWISELGG